MFALLIIYFFVLLKKKEFGHVRIFLFCVVEKKIICVVEKKKVLRC